jgi:hypothetical protein
MELIVSYLDIVLLDDLRRLGFIIDFLSKATIIGFMAGAAIIVSLLGICMEPEGIWKFRTHLIGRSLCCL